MKRVWCEGTWGKEGRETAGGCKINNFKTLYK